ncbi:MAG: hypothetical protein V7765_22045 [Oleispira sp.]
MTPNIWHKVSLKVELHKSRIIRLSFISLLLVLPLFFLKLTSSDFNKLLFVSTWAAMVLLFWCIGLLWVNRMYKKNPNSAESTGVANYMKSMFLWYNALFLSIWFFGLIVATLMVPYLLLFSKSS